MVLSACGQLLVRPDQRLIEPPTHTLLRRLNIPLDLMSSMHELARAGMYSFSAIVQEWVSIICGPSGNDLCRMGVGWELGDRVYKPCRVAKNPYLDGDSLSYFFDEYGFGSLLG